MKKKELEIATTTYTVAYKKGYTQCQEDMADNKYNEDHMLLAYVTGRANTDEDDKEVGKMRENFNRLLALIETRLNKT